MKLAAALIGIVLAAGAGAQTGPAPERAFIEGVQLVQRASAGDSRAVDPAVDAFEALSRAEPGNPLYAAYLGSATGLKARAAWMPWTKVKYGEQALDYADRALQALKPEDERRLVRGAPMDIETRIVVASLFVRVPDEIFHRRAAGRKLLDQVYADPRFASAPAPLRAAAEAARARLKESAQ